MSASFWNSSHTNDLAQVKGWLTYLINLIYWLSVICPHILILKVIKKKKNLHISLFAFVILILELAWRYEQRQSRKLVHWCHFRGLFWSISFVLSWDLEVGRGIIGMIWRLIFWGKERDIWWGWGACEVSNFYPTIPFWWPPVLVPPKHLHVCPTCAVVHPLMAFLPGKHAWFYLFGKVASSDLEQLSGSNPL